MRRSIQDLNSQQVSESCMFRPIRRAIPSSISPMEISYDQAWGGRRNVDRCSYTPQEQLNAAIGCLPTRVHKISGSSEYSDEGKMCYSSENEGKTAQTNRPVDLMISNLDPTIDIKELRRLLTNMLKEYAMILSLSITVQSDGTPIANIRVNSQQEAQFTISQLHRQKLGHKRIVISYSQSNSPDPEQLRAMVIAILQEVPDKKMPLFKFIEILESRYHCTVSVSEVNKLKDICKITDDLGSRIISLTQEVKASPPLTLVPYCIIHCPNGIQNRGWCELNTVQTPNIMMSLKLFAQKLNGLLNMHLGCMPLLSFQACYELEYHEPLPVDDSGVPLEHLISCVPNMDIKYVGTNKNIKVIKYDENRNIESDEDAVLKAVPPSLAPNISLLCRELVDLLKTTDKCQLLLSKFIPAYHHHFGRQCRVADYGYTKLIDLFESISHVVQIMGDGTRRVITLSHIAQMRRFTSDLLRVLKVQPSKQISITDFPTAYEKVMNKPFNAVEYGLCTFEDLLQEVPENTIVIAKNDDGLYISVPKREQTAEEIMRTKQYAAEVIDLLRHSPYYTMLFNKFVPAYHHHFGHQCKVSDYGFTKLIELFEAIPDVISELPDGERTVSLTLQQSLKILGSQVVQMIKNSKQSSIALDDVPRTYLREYGYPLKPLLYDCETVEEVINSNAGTLLVAIDMDTIPNTLKLRSWAILLDPPHCKDLATFRYEYQTRYNSNFSIETLQESGNVITISTTNNTDFVSLTVLYILAAQLYHIVYNHNGSILYNNIEKLYYETYGKPLKLSSYHMYSVDEQQEEKCCSVKRNLAEHLVPLPSSMYKSTHHSANNSKKETANWPPPYFPEMVQHTVKKVSPPKPDTPPTPQLVEPLELNSCICDEFINTDANSTQPQIARKSRITNFPARQLLPVSRNPWNTVEAPDPTELPMPDKLISKGSGMSDDSADSGVNIKLDNSPSDEENMSTENQLFGK
ncbi:hypothetical protein NQ317_017449 [Molorchus minor]|uniref:Meiosis regulator and mRNA stability factor 1 n=1 Tax=Molorchus minor TaxID=1323400 RepID=A0ABQ9JFD2_9CUCU|nr:hypothetical protein NQ317_017449 [Molorchus minor]